MWSIASRSNRIERLDTENGKGHIEVSGSIIVSCVTRVSNWSLNFECRNNALHTEEEGYRFWTISILRLYAFVSMKISRA